MKMRFSLATLLHLRKLREEQERAKLVLANTRRAQARAEIQELVVLRKESLGKNMGGHERVFGAQALFLRECCAVLGDHKNRAKQRQENADAAAARQEQAYVAARRDCEVLERFRERQEEVFLLMERRREQRQLDEAYVLVNACSGQTMPSNAAELAGLSDDSAEVIPQVHIGNANVSL